MMRQFAFLLFLALFVSCMTVYSACGFRDTPWNRTPSLGARWSIADALAHALGAPDTSYVQCIRHLHTCHVTLGCSLACRGSSIGAAAALAAAVAPRPK